MIKQKIEAASLTPAPWLSEQEGAAAAISVSLLSRVPNTAHSGFFVYFALGSSLRGGLICVADIQR